MADLLNKPMKQACLSGVLYGIAWPASALLVGGQSCGAEERIRRGFPAEGAEFLILR
jgi:hypothetical protein